MSVSEIAKRAYVRNYFIYDVIAGKSSNPSVVKLARVAKVLGVPLDRLMKAPKDEESEVRQVKRQNQNTEAPVFEPADIFIKLNKGDKLRPFDDVLQDVFINAVKFCNGDKTQAAEGLGISRTTFYRKVGAQRELLSKKQKD